MLTGVRRPCRAAAATGLALLGFLVVGCGRDGDDGSTPRTVAGLPAARMDGAVLGLCEARATAATDVRPARAAFYDRSHEPLHALARALEPVDRPLVARLLEAKEAVEAGLDSGSPTLTADLNRLLDVTRTGLTRLSAESLDCP